LYWYETFSLILREGHKLRVVEKSVLRRISGPERDDIEEAGEKCIMSSFINCTLRQM
jgi:hypothetical protein